MKESFPLGVCQYAIGASNAFRLASPRRYDIRKPLPASFAGRAFDSKLQKALRISREDLLALAVGDLLIFDGTDIHTG